MTRSDSGAGKQSDSGAGKQSDSGAGKQSDSGDTREHGHGYEHQDPNDWLPSAELDGEIFIPAVLDMAMAEVEIGSPGRIADIGCGPGVGTLELARRFPDAEVHGLDIGEAALDRGVARAASAGFSDRVHFTRADFDEDMTPHVGPMDLVFASMSLHHTEDPSAALGRACAMLNSGGRLLMAEFGRPLVMWPRDHPAVTTGLWERWQAAAEAARLDHLGEAAVNVDWAAVLQSQELDQTQEFECNIRFEAPIGPRERGWLTNGLTRGLRNNGERLSAEDRTMIEALLDQQNPAGVAQSNDVLLDTSRMIYTGIRP